MKRFIRFVSWNFWGLESDVEKRIALAIPLLDKLDVDVLCLQEVRPMDGQTTTADKLAVALNMNVHYEESVRWDNNAFPHGKPGSEGLAILSRLPIVEMRTCKLPEERMYEKRILLSTCIRSEYGLFWCHNTHLHWRLNDGVSREKQVMAIDDVVRSIETDMPQVIAGDFNATSNHDEIRFLKGEHSLLGKRTYYQDAYAKIHPSLDGFTWNQTNAHTHHMRSLDIDRRIDFLFVTPRRRNGLGTVVHADVVLTAFDEQGYCASDHYGVLAEVQIAED